VGVGIIALIVGLGMVINGLLLTVPKNRLAGGAEKARDGNLLDNPAAPAAVGPASIGFNKPTNELDHANESMAVPASVTEHTTHRLKS
jgi:hypothetical protein